MKLSDNPEMAKIQSEHEAEKAAVATRSEELQESLNSAELRSRHERESLETALDGAIHTARNLGQIAAYFFQTGASQEAADFYMQARVPPQSPPPLPPQLVSRPAPCSCPSPAPIVHLLLAPPLPPCPNLVPLCAGQSDLRRHAGTRPPQDTAVAAGPLLLEQCARHPTDHLRRRRQRDRQYRGHDGTGMVDAESE